MDTLTSIGIHNDTISAINKQLFVVRGMFYLLNPNETYFEKVEEVPDIRKLVCSLSRNYKFSLNFLSSKIQKKIYEIF